MKDVENIYGPQTITSIYRIDDPGVHGSLPCRGIDIRCRDQIFGAKMVSRINELWKYDPDRQSMKVAIAHGEGSNYHIHLQVHPNSVSVS